MRVSILEPRGYCAGVTNAVNTALRAKREHLDEPVYVLGMLVHNQEVIEQLKKEGLIFIDKKDLLKAAHELPNKSVVVFTAHGHPHQIDVVAKNKEFVIYDAICPKVAQNIGLIKNALNEGHEVIYIGLRNHPEARAALAISPNVYFYRINEPFEYDDMKDNCPLVVNQTTLNYMELQDIHKDILNHLPQAKIENEICNATRKRQDAIINLEQDVDCIIIVGDKKSSNANRLLEIAKNTHPQAECILVNSKETIKENTYKNKNHIVIASSASTPYDSINAIYKYLISR